MESTTETFVLLLPDDPRGRRRFAAAAVASLAAHLVIVGALWSAQRVREAPFRLAGGDGSAPLLASFERPQPADAVVVERLMPTQVRIEPDHMHVDRQLFTPTPPVDWPVFDRKPIEHAHHYDREHSAHEPHDHEHPHPLEPHKHDAAALQSVTALQVSTAQASIASASSTAQAAGNDETVPALFDNPPPEYPVTAFRARLEGTVLLRIGVRVDGSIESVEVLKSSGHTALDDAAVEAVKRWRFTPGRRGGRPAPFALRLPIEFKL